MFVVESSFCGDTLTFHNIPYMVMPDNLLFIPDQSYSRTFIYFWPYRQHLSVCGALHTDSISLCVVRSIQTTSLCVWCAPYRQHLCVWWAPYRQHLCVWCAPYRQHLSVCGALHTDNISLCVVRSIFNSLITVVSSLISQLKSWCDPMSDGAKCQYTDKTKGATHILF